MKTFVMTRDGDRLTLRGRVFVREYNDTAGEVELSVFDETDVNLKGMLVGLAQLDAGSAVPLVSATVGAAGSFMLHVDAARLTGRRLEVRLRLNGAEVDAIAPVIAVPGGETSRAGDSSALRIPGTMVAADGSHRACPVIYDASPDEPGDAVNRLVFGTIVRADGTRYRMDDGDSWGAGEAPTAVPVMVDANGTDLGFTDVLYGTLDDGQVDLGAATFRLSVVAEKSDDPFTYRYTTDCFRLDIEEDAGNTILPSNPMEFWHLGGLWVANDVVLPVDPTTLGGFDSSVVGDIEFASITDTEKGIGTWFGFPSTSGWDGAHIAYVSCQTGIPKAQVWAYAAATKIHEKLAAENVIDGLANEAFIEATYGLLRTGAPADVVSLGRMSRTSLRAHLLEAAERHLISATYLSHFQQDTFIDELRGPNLGVIVGQDGGVFSRVAEPLKKPLETLLGPAPSYSDIGDLFIAISGGRPADRTWWSEFSASSSLDAATIDAGQLAYDLNRCLRGEADIIEALVDHATTPVATHGDFASWTVESLTQLIDANTSGTVPFYEANRDLARLAVGAFESARPELVYAERAEAQTTGNDLSKVLRAIDSEGLDLLALDLAALENDAEHAVWATSGVSPIGPTGTTAVVYELREARRAFRLLPPLHRHESVSALLAVTAPTTDPGSHVVGAPGVSAQRIIGLGHDAFVTEFALALRATWKNSSVGIISPSETSEEVQAATDYAERVWKNARRALAASELHQGVLRDEQGPRLFRADPPGVGSAPLPGDGSPSLEPLWCRCNPCSSALGPSAYLYDILDFCESNGLMARLRTFEVMSTPDAYLWRQYHIVDLKMHCDNTETELPYIDLAIEHLEWKAVAVAHHANLTLPDASPVPTVVPPPSETTWDADRLGLEAEHTDNRAPTELLFSNELYPRPLPVDLPAEEYRALFTREGLSRPTVMAALMPCDADHTADPPTSGVTQLHVALEELGWLRREWAMLAHDLEPSDPPFKDIAGWFGQDATNAAWTEALTEVATFVDASGIALDQVLELLSCRTVNPACTIVASAAEGDLCDLASGSITADDVVRYEIVESGGLLGIDEANGFTSAKVFSAGNGFVVPSEVQRTDPTGNGTYYICVDETPSRAVYAASESLPSGVEILQRATRSGSTFTVSSAPTGEFYERVIRLLLTQRAIGGTLRDADALLDAVLQSDERGAGSWTSDTVVRLAAAVRLKHKLGVDWDTFRAFAAGWDARGAWRVTRDASGALVAPQSFADSVYDRRFQSEATWSPLAPSLAADATASEVVNPSAQLDDTSDTDPIAEAVRAGSTASLATFKATLALDGDHPWALPDTDLTMANLTRVTRVAIMARACGVTGPTLLSYGAWIADSHPLEGADLRIPDFDAVSRWIDDVRLLVDRGITPDEALYFLVSAGDDAEPASVTNRLATLVDVQRRVFARRMARPPFPSSLVAEPFDPDAVIATSVPLSTFADFVPHLTPLFALSKGPDGAASAERMVALVDSDVGSPTDEDELAGLLTLLLETIDGLEIPEGGGSGTFSDVADWADFCSNTGTDQERMEQLWRVGTQFYMLTWYRRAIGWADGSLDIPGLDGSPLLRDTALIIDRALRAQGMTPDVSEDEPGFVLEGARDFLRAVSRPRLLVADGNVVTDFNGCTTTIGNLYADAVAAYGEQLSNEMTGVLPILAVFEGGLPWISNSVVPDVADPFPTPTDGWDVDGGWTGSKTVSQLFEAMDAPISRIVCWVVILFAQLAPEDIERLLGIAIGAPPSWIGTALRGWMDASGPSTADRTHDTYAGFAIQDWLDIATWDDGTDETLDVTAAATHGWLHQQFERLAKLWWLTDKTGATEAVWNSVHSLRMDTALGRADQFVHASDIFGTDAEGAGSPDPEGAPTTFIFPDVLVRTVRLIGMEAELHREATDAPTVGDLLQPLLADASTAPAVLGPLAAHRFGGETSDWEAFLGNGFLNIDGITWTGDGAVDLLPRLALAHELALRWSSDLVELLPIRSEAPTTDDVVAFRGLARQSFDDDAWRRAYRPIADALRERRRDALVAFLLLHHPTWNDTTDIHEAMLFDPMVNACTTITRMVFAHLNVQLYVQRVAMGLEEGVPALSREAKAQWAWMKQYRVWEANRKVFLYPENWIEPDLRLDGTPLYEAVERSVQKASLTPEDAESAFEQYLDDLAAISRLEVVSHHRVASPGSRPEVHVLATTKSREADAYYRRRSSTGVWSHWERVEAEVNPDSAVVVSFEGRTLIGWATADQDTSQSADAVDRWNIDFSMIERVNGAWARKATTTRAGSVETVAPILVALGYDPLQSLKLAGRGGLGPLAVTTQFETDALGAGVLRFSIGGWRAAVSGLATFYPIADLGLNATARSLGALEAASIFWPIIDTPLGMWPTRNLVTWTPNRTSVPDVQMVPLSPVRPTLALPTGSGAWLPILNLEDSGDGAVRLTPEHVLRTSSFGKSTWLDLDDRTYFAYHVLSEHPTHRLSLDADYDSAFDELRDDVLALTTNVHAVARND